MMKREQFLKLLSRKLSGEISDADHEVLNREIESNEEYKRLTEELGHYFNSIRHRNHKTGQLEGIWEKIENDHISIRADFSRPRNAGFFYSNLFRVAAVLMIFLVSGIMGYYLLIERSTDQSFNKMVTAYEKKFRLLDDGTKIWLNKRSSISYNKAFGKDKREIFLVGEAYFDVARNEVVPLYIHAGNIDIEVKGTAFNVNAYRENKKVEVALIRGAIQVVDRFDENNRVLLRPNERLIFPNLSSRRHDNFFLVAPMDLQVGLFATRWTSDTLIFQKEKLKDLALQMEKKYDLKIEIQSEKLSGKRFSGTFTNETIQQALEALKLSYPLTYTINNRLIILNDQP